MKLNFIQYSKSIFEKVNLLLEQEQENQNLISKSKNEIQILKSKFKIENEKLNLKNFFDELIRIDNEKKDIVFFITSILYFAKNDLDLDIVSIEKYCIDFLVKKSSDYSEVNNRYSCFERIVELMGIRYIPFIKLIKGLAVQQVMYFNICQKIARIENVVLNNKSVNFESLRDSIIDLINYRLLVNGAKYKL